jgi:hypothetical protein
VRGHRRRGARLHPPGGEHIAAVVCSFTHCPSRARQPYWQMDDAPLSSCVSNRPSNFALPLPFRFFPSSSSTSGCGAWPWTAATTAPWWRRRWRWAAALLAAPVQRARCRPLGAGGGGAGGGALGGGGVSGGGWGGGGAPPPPPPPLPCVCSSPHSSPTTLLLHATPAQLTYATCPDAPQPPHTRLLSHPACLTRPCLVIPHSSFY